MVEPILQALQGADNALSVQLPATLAGLTLTALTFLTLRLGDLKDRLGKLTDPMPLGRELPPDNKEVIQLEGKISDVRGAALDFYRAFFLFLASLLLMLAVFDTALGANIGDLATEISDVGVTGLPFTAGLISTLLGARKINKHYLTPLPKMVAKL